MGIKHVLRQIEMKHGAILGIIISAILVLVLPGNHTQTQAAELSLAVTGILFGLVIGFYFSDLWDRWRSIRENTAIETSGLTSYIAYTRLFSVNNKKWCENQKKLIIEYLRQYFKLEWGMDSSPQDIFFSKINESLKEVKLKSNEEIETWSSLLGALFTVSEAHDKNNLLGKDKLSQEEWIVILILGGALLLALFYLRTDELSSILFTFLLTAATFTLFFVIRDLSNLSIGEEDIAFEPYLKVFDEMGVPRQYWKEDIDKRRVKLPKDRKYEIFE